MTNFFDVPIEEQETVVQWDRKTGLGSIYTSDSRYVNKFNTLYGEGEKFYHNGKLVGIKYTIDKTCLDFKEEDYITLF